MNFSQLRRSAECVRPVILFRHGMALACLFSAAAFGQPSATLGFEAASVKVSTSQAGRGNMRGGPGTNDPGRISLTNVTLFNVVLRAYNLMAFQLSAQDRMSSRKYDIAAVVPAGVSKEQCNRMLQALLAERFNLVVHHETRSLQGFDLVTVRGGSKLKASEVSGAPASGSSDTRPKADSEGYPELIGPGLIMMEGAKAGGVIVFLTAKSQPISALVHLLSREFQMPIGDQTGLQGNFDFKLAFAPKAPGELPPPTAPESPTNTADDVAPNLTSAVQQQLGLRLNPRKVPTDILVVDRADQLPTQN
jgi:uncharacterized protein (TIGR03435 family)